MRLPNEAYGNALPVMLLVLRPRQHKSRGVRLELVLRPICCCGRRWDRAGGRRGGAVQKLVQPIVLGKLAKYSPHAFQRRYDVRLSIGGIDGESKAAFIVSVVERGCEESSYLCEREAFRASNGQETWSYAGRGRAEGDEAWSSVSVNQTESSLAPRDWLGVLLSAMRLSNPIAL